MIGQGHLRLIFFGITILLLVTYLISINNTATKGIEISQMEKKIGDLTKEQRSLETKVDELKSLNRIETISNNDLSMVSADKYIYLKLQPSPNIAVK